MENKKQMKLFNQNIPKELYDKLHDDNESN